MLIATFVSILGFNLTFPFLPLYIQQLGVSDAGRAAFWSGVIGSVAGLLAAVAAPIWGQLADRSGRRRMLIRATVGPALGLVIMGLAPGLVLLLAGRVAFGVMAGTIPAANPLLAANTPPEHLSSAMGMLQSSVYISNAAGPILGGLLASTVGYRAAFLITAALYVLSALPVIWLVRERFEPPAVQTPLVRGMAANFRMVFRSPDLTLPMFGAFLSFAAFNAIFPVLPLHIGDLVGEANVERASGLAFGVQGVASTIAAFLLGAVTRRWGYRRLLLGGPPLLCLGYVGLWIAPGYLLLLVLLALLGIVQGLVVPALSALLALRTPRETAGAVFGVVSSVNSFAFSGAPFVGGLLASAFGLRAAFPFSALLMLGMALICVRVARGEIPTSAPRPTLPARPRERRV